MRPAVLDDVRADGQLESDVLVGLRVHVRNRAGADHSDSHENDYSTQRELTHLIPYSGYNGGFSMKRYFCSFRRGSGRPDVQSSCKQTPPANVAAEVNNHAITYAELDKTYQSQFPQPVEGSNEDQVMSQKLEMLSSLITSEIMLQRAEKAGADGGGCRRGDQVQQDEGALHQGGVREAAGRRGR